MRTTEQRVSTLKYVLEEFIIHTDTALNRLEREMEDFKVFKDEMKVFKDEMSDFKDRMENSHKGDNHGCHTDKDIS